MCLLLGSFEEPSILFVFEFASLVSSLSSFFCWFVSLLIRFTTRLLFNYNPPGKRLAPGSGISRQMVLINSFQCLQVACSLFPWAIPRPMALFLTSEASSFLHQPFPLDIRWRQSRLRRFEGGAWFLIILMITASSSFGTMPGAGCVACCEIPIPLGPVVD